jgi:hypothetical protein
MGHGAFEEIRLMWLWLLWWCVDDHLAMALETPGLGELPIWVPLIISLAISFTFTKKMA